MSGILGVAGSSIDGMVPIYKIAYSGYAENLLQKVIVISIASCSCEVRKTPTHFLRTFFL